MFLHFLADINLPEEKSQEFKELIPYQFSYIKKLIKKGIIQNYALSSDRKKLWVLFVAKDKHEARNIIGQFPIFNFMTFKILPLLYNRSAQTEFPQLWLN